MQLQIHFSLTGPTRETETRTFNRLLGGLGMTEALLVARVLSGNRSNSNSSDSSSNRTVCGYSAREPGLSDDTHRLFLVHSFRGTSFFERLRWLVYGNDAA